MLFQGRRLTHLEFYLYLDTKRIARSLIPEQKPNSFRKQLQRLLGSAVLRRLSRLSGLARRRR